MGTKVSKITAAEAHEYSLSLGKAATGNYELMDFAIHTLGVPAALGMEPEDWAESLGGYVRMGVERRREAVRELSGKRTEDKNGVSRYERSATAVAEILGISKNTVHADREVLEAQARTIEDTENRQIEAPAVPSRGNKEKAAENKAKIRRLLDAGKTNAEIALELNVGVSTVGKERAAWKKENEKPHPLAEQASRDIEAAGSSPEELQAARDEEATEERLREEREVAPILSRIFTASIDAAQRVRAYGVHSTPSEIEGYLDQLSKARAAIDELLAAFTEARNEAHLEKGGEIA